MLNPEAMLLDAEAAIKKRPASPAGRWHLVFEKGKFVCVPVGKKRPIEISIGTFSEFEINKGLTTKQWNTLKTKIAYIIKSGRLT